MDKDQKHREKLMNDVRQEVISLFEKALDYSQIACPSQEIFKALRSKILRSGNDCIRNIERKLRHFNVEYIPQTEEIIEVTHKKN